VPVLVLEGMTALAWGTGMVVSDLVAVLPAGTANSAALPNSLRPRPPYE
jgi:hypothetical protein